MSADLAGLPLFDWRPTARVLPFPADRRAALVRRTAARLVAERDGIALAEGIDLVRQALEPVNLDEALAWRQIWAFHEAVQAELFRQSPQRGRR